MPEDAGSVVTPSATAGFGVTPPAAPEDDAAQGQVAEARVRYFAAARAATGVAEEALDGGHGLAGLLELAISAHPGAADVLRRCSLLVDGIRRTPDDRPLPAGALVDVLPPFAGG